MCNSPGLPVSGNIPLIFPAAVNATFGCTGANVAPASASVPGKELWLLPRTWSQAMGPAAALLQEMRAVAPGGIFVCYKDAGPVNLSQALLPQS